MSDYGTHRIVVGFDGSSDSLAALDWAMTEAPLRDLAVVACHVWHWPDDHDEAAEAERVLVAAGEQVLEQGMKHGAAHGSAVALTSQLVRGNPAERLIRASTDADLLVVGTHGCGGVPGPRAGSVSVQTARHAHCPVIVTHDDSERDQAPSADGRIVVGVDGSPGADIAVRFAFAEAARRQAPLHAVHAYDDASAAGSGPADAQRQLHEWLRRRATSYSGVQVSERVVAGNAGQALLDASADAALLVLGSRGHGGVATAIMGSTNDTVLHRAACPTAFVR